MIHDCLILKNKFAKENHYYCHLCGKQYAEINSVKEGLLLDLYNFLMDENYLVTSAEAVVVWTSERLKEIKK